MLSEFQGFYGTNEQRAGGAGTPGTSYPASAPDPGHPRERKAASPGLSALVSSYFILGPWPQSPPWSPYLFLLSAPAPLQTELGLQKPHRDPNKQSDQ